MKIKPDWTRVLSAVRHQEPDRVPMFEGSIHPSIMSRFLGREVTADSLDGQVEFMAKAGYDFTPVDVSMIKPGKVTKDSHISKVIRQEILKDSEEADDPRAWNLELTSFIREREDFERFPWDAAAAVDTRDLVRVADYLPEGMAAVAVSGKIFTLTWMLMGFNNFSAKLIMDEPLVADVFRKVAEIQFKALEDIFRHEHVAALWAIDDLAFGSGPIISPEALRTHVFPWYREMAKLCHDNGRLFIFHSDGKLDQIMEDLIDVGVDLLHPIDPGCMDIFEVKRQWGQRIAFAGNVPNEMLRSAKPEEVRAYVLKLLKECAPGGGYCLAAGNSVPDWAAFENYQAMRETGLEYGSYPIRA